MQSTVSSRSSCGYTYALQIACSPKGKTKKAPAQLQQEGTANRGGFASCSAAAGTSLPVLKQPGPGRPSSPPAEVASHRPRVLSSDLDSEESKADIIDWLERRLGNPKEPQLKQHKHLAKDSKGNVGDTSNDRVVAHALLTLPQHSEVAVVLEQASLSSMDVSRLLSLLSRQGHKQMAMRVFDWVDRQSRYELQRPFFYTKLMSALNNTEGGTEMALQLYDRMRASDVMLDLVAYNTAISAAGKAGYWRRTLDLLDELRAAGWQPDVFTYSSLIKACQICGNRWRDALLFMDEMKRAGVKPNVITYTTLMSCCQRAGQWERAMIVFRDMEFAGVCADVKAYNSVISACARGARWENAWEVFGTMRRAGVQPNARSYNALISACERAGQPKRALEAFRNMQRDAGHAVRLKATIVTYNTLMSACGKAGMFDTVQDLFEDMQDKGIEPDAFTLTALITACNHEGYWEDAMAMAEEFHRCGVRLNTIAGNALIAGLGKAGRWEYALQVFEQMQSGEADGRPDARTYGSLALAYRRGQKYLELLELYNKMKALRMPIYKDVYHAVLEACERAGLWKEGRAVLEAMQADHHLGKEDLGLAAWQAVFAFPPLMDAVPKPLMAVARAAVESGRWTRRWCNGMKENEVDDDDEGNDA